MDAGKAFNFAMTLNSQIEALNLKGNFIPETQLEMIQQKVEKNKIK